MITVLQGASPRWDEEVLPILDRRVPWGYVVWGAENGTVVNTLGVDKVFGFTQQADDDLSFLEFIHTCQIPGLR